ncbi:hypothetical protein CALCODRAFT_485948 [Calocera cornea HHB12733]|uniref:Fucose-specific lectin n=1 Tax=Calocera cornea HHB12733 TaxID=1353952 RepID=A0A165E1Y5_9BASI|nr:hypothetical protein CALCODRAFT_485948 [Calocera cornea HHB12733]
MLAAKLLSLVTFLTFALLAYGLTNGERISRGMTPAKPRRLFEPTRVHVARQSDTPPSIGAKIAVVAAGSAPLPENVLAYVGPADDEIAEQFPTADTPTDPTQAALLSYSVNQPVTNIFTTDTDQTYYLSAMSMNSNLILSASNRNFAIIGFSDLASAVGAPPSTVLVGQFFSVESAIWTVLVASGQILPTWVNTDGSRPTISTLLADDSLYITANPSGARLTLGGGVAVDIYFVDF